MSIVARHILVLTFFSLSLSSSVHARECNKIVISADSDYAPLHWYDGKKLTGASIEIASTALTALHVPFEVRYVGPFQRVLQEAKSGEIDMIASLKETPERHEYLLFSSVALFSNPIAVFVAKDKPFPYSNWQDLIGKKGGITLGYQFGGGFDEFLQANLKIETAQKTYMNFEKLELGQINYLVTGYYSGIVYLQQTGQENNFSVLKPYISETANLIGISKLSPCVKYMASLDKELDRMQKNGTLTAILKKHIALIPTLGKKRYKDE